MSRELWQRARDVFLDALERAPASRDHYVREICAGDTQLLHAVTTLLAGHDESSGIDDLATPQGALDELQGGIRRQGAALASYFDAGTQVDDFEILGVLGEGGMATVYRARRLSADFEQEVALKVLAGHRLSDVARERFDRERRIAASLDHPNIAKLIDGGVTSDGRPYFALELIDGEPIDAYCDRNRLAIKARIELVRDAAAAVQYAHRYLLVHRDLKPSNLLVDQHGIVKLLDFGIAKRLDASDPELTRTGGMPLTPSYASPEQFQGEELTTASDQYQLGLLLFELVTGHRHHLLEGSDPGSMGRRIIELETPRPSAVLSSTASSEATDRRPLEQIAAARRTVAADLVRDLRGDLDTILLTALQKDPNQRYPSVAAFSEDLERFCRNQPISAQPASTVYRARKFYERHSIAVTAALAAVVALIAGTSIATWQAVRASEAEQVALREAATATETSDFLVELFAAADPNLTGGQELSARQILDRGRRQLDQREFADPVVSSRMRTAIAKSYHRISDLQAAEEIARQAIADLEREVGADSAAVADVLVALADTVARLDRNQELLELHQRALAIREPLFGRQSEEVAQNLAGIGRAKAHLGDFRTAIAHQREALAIRRAVHDGPHPATSLSLYFLASTLTEDGRYDEAVPLFLEAAEIDVATQGEVSTGHAETLNMLALTYHYQGRFEESIEVQRRSIDIQAEIYGPDHYASYRGLEGLAISYIELARYEEAEELIRRSLEGKQRLFGAESNQVAGALHNLGYLHQDQGLFEEAERIYRRAIEMRAAHAGYDHPRIAELSENLGETLLELGEVDEAEQLFDRSLAIKTRLLANDHPRLSWPHWGLGLVALERRQLESAAEHFSTAHDYIAQGLGEEHPDLAYSLHSLGKTRHLQGRLEEAESLLRRSLELRASLSPERLTYKRTAADLEKLLSDLGRQ